MLITLGGILMVTTLWMVGRYPQILDDLDEIVEKEETNERH